MSWRESFNTFSDGMKQQPFPGAFAALCAPAPLTLVGENEPPAILQSVYAAANSSDRLRRSAEWSGELVGQLLK